jgi:transcription termination factor Rho
LDVPKKMFVSARAFEEGGSLTIVATALVDTGRRMDEVIFQEFKGTGNIEVVLDRALVGRRVWPAIDISQSRTRREEMLLDAKALQAATMLRRSLSSRHHVEAMEELISKVARFGSNEELVQLLAGERDRSACEGSLG